MLFVLSFEIAKYISEDSYGLIFGVNTFFALLAQSLLTFIVIDKLTLTIQQQVRFAAKMVFFRIREILCIFQFFVYGGYFMALAAIYIMMGVVNIVQHYRSGERFRIWSDNDKSLSVMRNASDVTSSNVDGS